MCHFLIKLHPFSLRRGEDKKKFFLPTLSTLAIKESNDVFIIRVASVAFSLATIVSGAVTIN